MSYGAMRWLAAAAAAGAFVVALSLQTVRGSSEAPAGGSARTESAIISDSTPATAPSGGGRLVAVSVPALRMPAPTRKRRATPAPVTTAPPAQLVDAPVATPTPQAVATPAPVVAAPAPAPAPVPRPAPAKPQAPAHGPGFDSSG